MEGVNREVFQTSSEKRVKTKNLANTMNVSSSSFQNVPFYVNRWSKNKFLGHLTVALEKLLDLPHSKKGGVNREMT